ncbi:siderophore-interacting protein [Saccharopolyspora taberi]|uniref:Siderophore-interacting protein n=1 Tax=Saccharopolyspora taberi TaxID=60895 RepID=A0ABN3VE21_9PSEU
MSIPTPLRQAAAAAFRLFRTEVRGVRRVGGNLTRITFGGPELAGMACGGLDQRVKLILPLPGQELELPEGDRPYQRLRELPNESRPHFRSYTVRAHRPESCEFDIDFVLHGDAGPGTSFARTARVGDRLAVYAPDAEHAHGARFGGVEYRMDALGDRTLIVGDETALPAIGSILETLPAGVAADVYVEIPDPSDEQVLETDADAEVHWLARSGCERPGVLMTDAIRAARLSSESYCWVAGERAMVTTIRRHLISERDFDRESVTFMGYWRNGESEGSRPAAG